MMIFTHKSVKIHKLGNKVKNCHDKYDFILGAHFQFDVRNSFQNLIQKTHNDIEAPSLFL